MFQFDCPGAPTSGRETRLADFRVDKVSEQASLEEARGPRYWTCGHQYWIGTARVSEGDRERAREAFKASVDTGLWSVFYHTQSQIMLARLKDPAWPKWLPAKDEEARAARSVGQFRGGHGHHRTRILGEPAG
jgi:hypothetical protein